MPELYGGWEEILMTMRPTTRKATVFTAGNLAADVYFDYYEVLDGMLRLKLGGQITAMFACGFWNYILFSDTTGKEDAEKVARQS